MPSAEGQVRFSRSARADIREAAAYYATQDSSLEVRFRTSLAETVDALMALPESFPVVHADTRRAMLKVFPYGVFFRHVGHVSASSV